ncbi:DUF445 family protein [Veillonella sp. R32]|uniref:DUF445 family protein n=1 Tax=Veillonella sp. R32 TaxID=2021312 RepID=UPI00138A379C|nr:DUF445 family protein [Veillonella sp. R32]KAF1683239.1 DUF445 domain-containing protein [Veillonella sp. R32]
MKQRTAWPVATLLLLVMMVIFLAVYPFRGDPLFGFLTHVSGAAMIGGLADWYAVTALFTKPLGISYKTALIPRSKARLVETARYMMVEELLRVQPVYMIIKKEQLPKRILMYFLSEEGRRQINQFIEEVGTQMGSHFDGAPLRKEVTGAIKKGVAHWEVAPLLIRFGHLMMQRDTAAVLWLYVNRMAQRLLSSQGIQPYIVGIVASMMNRYAENSFWRELALALGSDSFSPERVAELIQQKGTEFLASQESIHSPMGQYVYNKVLWSLSELERNSEWRQTVENVKNRWLQDALEDVDLSGDTKAWQGIFKRAQEEAEAYARSLLQDKGKLQSLERLLLYQLVPLLRKLRPFVDTSVVRELMAYSPQKLSDVIKGKLYHDLQMIRINGSLVGAVLGGLFYVAAQLVQGGVGL